MLVYGLVLPSTISSTPPNDITACIIVNQFNFSFKIGTARITVIKGPKFNRIDTFTIGKIYMHTLITIITQTIYPNAIRKVENSNNLNG